MCSKEKKQLGMPNTPSYLSITFMKNLLSRFFNLIKFFELIIYNFVSIDPLCFKLFTLLLLFSSYTSLTKCICECCIHDLDLHIT